MFIERRSKDEPWGMLAVKKQALNHTVQKLSALDPETTPKWTTTFNELKSIGSLI